MSEGSPFEAGHMTEDEINQHRKELAESSRILAGHAETVSAAMKQLVAQRQQVEAISAVVLTMCVRLGIRELIDVDEIAADLADLAKSHPGVEPSGAKLLTDLSARLLQISADLQRPSMKN